MFSRLLSLYSFDLDQDLSYSVERLDAIESKVDQLLKAKNTAESSGTKTSLPQTPSPILFKGVSPSQLSIALAHECVTI